MLKSFVALSKRNKIKNAKGNGKYRQDRMNINKR